MKKIYLVLFLSIFVSLSFARESETSVNITKESTVYVCGKSKIYHKTITHSALNRCKSGITKMTESKAKKLGKRVCKCRG